MPTPSHPSPPPLVGRTLSRRAGWTVAGVGAMALVGWALNLPVLKSLHPSLLGMEANTAFGFLLSGVGLALNADSRTVRGAQVLGGIVALLGLLTFSQDLIGVDFRIDQALFRDAPGALSLPPPGRMAPTTALCFLSLGLALGAPDAAWGPVRPSDLLWGLAGLLALLILVGHLYQAESLVDVGPFIRMAPYTALTFILLAAGGLAARFDRGPFAFLLGSDETLRLAKVLLPVTFGLPLVLGWLHLVGLRAGAYSPALGTALMAVVVALLSSLVALVAARSLHTSVLHREEARSELARQASIHQAILQNLGEGVVVADAAGHFLVFNPAAERIVGIGAVDKPPTEWSSAYGAFLPDRTTPFPPEEVPLLLALTGQPTDNVEQFLCNQARPEGVFVSITGRPVRDEASGFQGGVVLVRDITAHRQEEEELRKAKAALEASNQELEAFAYTVSHDLRAPLRHIDGFTALLRKSLEGRLDPKQAHHMDVISEGARRMGELIDGLLGYARLGRAELHRVPLPMEPVVRQALAQLEPPGEPLRADISIGPLPTVEADPTQLRLVWQNLLGNALKYSSRTPFPRIRVGARTVEDGETAFFVEDNGAGFDPAYQNKLFGVFQRLHHAKDFEGTGIGLASVARIVSRHGGRVWAEGAVGRGATFYFTLPTPSRG